MGGDSSLCLRSSRPLVSSGVTRHSSSRARTVARARCAGANRSSGRSVSAPCSVPSRDTSGIGISFSPPNVPVGSEGVNGRLPGREKGSLGAGGIRGAADPAVAGPSGAPSETPRHASGPRAQGPGTTTEGNRPGPERGAVVAAADSVTGGVSPEGEPDGSGSG